jgi:O-methyltransferase
MLKQAVDALLRQTPYELRRREADSQKSAFSDYELAESIRRAATVVGTHSMLAPEGLAVLYQQVAHCQTAGIEGALVECGVWHGGSAALIARAALDHGERARSLHLFDSFEGIPEPDAEVDGARATREVGGQANARGRLRVAWDYAERGGPGSEAGVRDLLTRFGFPMADVHVYQGWFQETVPAAAPTIGPIALLHLDGDWYASTKVCLDHLYDKVVSGGFVTINDYGAYAGCRRAVDELLATLKPMPFLTHVNQEIRYWIKPGTSFGSGKSVDIVP